MRSEKSSKPNSLGRYLVWQWSTVGVVALYWLLLLVATHLPELPAAVEMDDNWDKVWHLVGYAGLGYLVALAWSSRRGVLALPNARELLGVVVVVSAYGVVDELTQPWFGRHCELADWFCDLLGASMGVLALAGTVGLAQWVWFSLRRARVGE